MFCPWCGATSQNGRFCAHCGKAISASAPASPPTITNDVNVSVNVGAPTIVQPNRPSTLGQQVAQGALNAFQAARQAKREAEARRAALQKLHAQTLANLNTCHDMIAEIESSILLELLPPESATRLLYARGLEARCEAAGLLSERVTDVQLTRAYSLVVHALEDFRSANEQIRFSLPDNH